MVEFREVYRHGYESRIETELATLGDTIRLWQAKAVGSDHRPGHQVSSGCDDYTAAMKQPWPNLKK